MINECSIIRDILPLYHEDMVSEDTAAFVRQHLEKCEDCRKELEALKSDSDIADMTDEQTDEDKAALLALKKKMKRKKITTIAVTALCIIAAIALCVQFYFYMNISGKRLDNLDKLDEVPLSISVLPKKITSGHLVTAKEVLCLKTGKTMTFSSVDSSVSRISSSQ